MNHFTILGHQDLQHSCLGCIAEIGTTMQDYIYAHQGFSTFSDQLLGRDP